MCILICILKLKFAGNVNESAVFVSVLLPLGLALMWGSIPTKSPGNKLMTGAVCAVRVRYTNTTETENMHKTPSPNTFRK